MRELTRHLLQAMMIRFQERRENGCHAGKLGLDPRGREMSV
jgi:hypothetical protein